MDAIFGRKPGGVSAEAQASAQAGVPSSVPRVDEATGVEVSDARTEPMCALASRVIGEMRVNYDFRRTSGVDDRLRYAISAQTCTYSPDQLDKLRKAGVPSRVYMPITASKVRAAKSMLVELATYGEDMPFAIDPTPDPEVPKEIEEEVVAKSFGDLKAVFGYLQQTGVEELPPDAMEKIQSLVRESVSASYDSLQNGKDAWARTRAKRLERRVYDIFAEGGFENALMKCIDHVCTYGTCVMVGPVMRNVARNRSVKNRRTGVVRVKREIRSIPFFEAVNPVDCYPAPDAESVTDGPLCIRVRYTREELWRFSRNAGSARDRDGWRESGVASVLSMFTRGCRLDEFPRDQAVRSAENNASDSSDDCRFEGIRCFMAVQGRELMEIGVTRTPSGDAVKLDEFYDTETIVLGGTVVYCRVFDARVGMPLSKGVFYELAGSWWGESIADKLFAVQTVMNNAVVSMLRNMGPASSGMLWINDVSRLVDKSPNGLAAEPGKVFAFASSFTGQTAAGAPMGLLQLPSNANELLQVAKWANYQADLDSGIPAFAEGTGGSNGGALRTAEGLRTYTEAAARGMKMVIMFLDRGVIRDQAKRTADLVLVFDDDIELKGDVEVRAVGIMGRLLKAQNDQARLQLLNLSLNSQLLQQIIGPKGIIALFRPSCKDINVNPDRVCPSDERMDMLEQLDAIKQVYAATQQQQQQQQPQEEQGPQGMMPGVTPIAQVGGGVSGRRGVA